MENLRSKFASSVIWQGSAKISSQFFSFIVSIILARILTPSDYGVFGIALLYIGFLELINDLGLGASIIQKKEISNNNLSSIFWINIMVGFILFCISYVLAPIVAAFFQSYKAKAIIQALSLNFIIDSIRTVPLSILTKELHFAARSRAELIAVFIGGLLSIVLAYKGLGVWSLVISVIVQGVLLTIIVCWYSNWKPSFVLNVRESLHFINFGFKLMLTRFQWYAYSNADFFISGKILGDKMLGYYTMAYRMALLPTEKLSAIINQVAFPTFSILQDDNERLKRYYLQITRSISLIAFPVMTGLFILADLFIAVVLTDKWMPALVALRILCLIGALKTIDVFIPQLLIAKGQVNHMLKYTTVLFFVLPIGFYVGSFKGINGIAYAWLAIYPVAFFFLVRSVSKSLDIAFIEYLRSISPQILCSALMGISIWSARNFINETMSINQVWLLVLLSLIGFAIYALCSLIFMRNLLSDIRSVVVSR